MEEIVIKLAGMAAQSLMEGDGASAQIDRLRDELAKLIEAAVERICEFVDAALDERVIADVQSHIDGCVDLIENWSSAPEIEQPLFDAITAATFALKRLDDFGWKQMEAYGDGCSVNLLALVSAAKHVNEGYLENAVRFVDRSSDKMDGFLRDGRAYFQALINGVGQVYLGGLDQGITHGPEKDVWYRAGADFFDNGAHVHVVRQGDNKGKVIDEAMGEAQRLRRERLAARQAAHDEFAKVEGDLVEKRKEAWRSAVEAGDRDDRLLSHDVAAFKQMALSTLISRLRTIHPEGDWDNIKLEDIKYEFASDKAIRDYMNGGRDWCCTLKAAIPFNGEVCVIPPGASPNNMCPW